METTVTKILHLSDLHLGDDIVFRSLIRHRRWWEHVDNRVTNGLVKAIRELKPDFVIISGDFVNKAQRSTFRFASEYLKELFQKAGFDMAKRLLTIPGNHDVSFLPRKQPDDFKRLRDYREFLRDLFNEEDVEKRAARYVHVYPPGKLVFVCLDSTLKNHRPLAEGEIGESQRDWVREELRKLREQIGNRFRDYTKIAVLHHHCVPIPGVDPSGERFMHLLDGGDVLKLFADLGFNIVLHGHKHVPHTQHQTLLNSAVLTVVGAGSTTCAFLEDQGGFGNTFNWLILSPERNEIRVDRYKANQIGEFEAVATNVHNLFRMPSALGYSVDTVRKITHIEPDGVTKVTVIKEGLRIEQPGKKMHTVELQASTSAPGARITDFQLLSSDGDLKIVASGETIILGEAVLKEPLTFDSAPIRIAYSYTLVGGNAMSQVEYASMYSSEQGKNEERTGLAIIHPTKTLKMEVHFPDGFRTDARAYVEHLGQEISIAALRHRFEYDRDANRCELELQDPPLEHRIAILWSLPQTWAFSGIRSAAGGK